MAKKTRKRAAKKAATPTPPSPDQREVISMDQAIKLLKVSRATFYRWLRAGEVEGMKVGRQWRFYRDNVERFLRGQEPRVDLPAGLGPLLRDLQAKLKEAGGAYSPPAEMSEVQQAVAPMVALGRQMRASDLHVTLHVLEGSPEGVGVLRYRVDGVLHEAARIDRRLAGPIVDEWKRRAACNVHEKARPQDGRAQFVLREPGKKDKEVRPLDIRISFLPSCLGETLTARILDPAEVHLDLDRFGYREAELEKLRRAVRSPSGLILMTGPTGTGKTTTLYSCLNEVAGPEVKIMTVEDPVEFNLPWATQVQLNEAHDLTWPVALRSFLRSSADVIMVGECRNSETLWICHQAAMTGHRVLTTLHANDAASGLTRMLEMGVNPFVVADSTLLVMSQRLVRRLCKECSATDKPSADQLRRAEQMADAGGVAWGSLKKSFRKAVGCPKCAHTGYRGRIVVAEVLEVTPRMKEVLVKGGTTEEFRNIAIAEGMTTMAADAVRRAAAGETTLDEVMRVLPPQ